MTAKGQKVAAPWKDPAYAEAWATGDAASDWLTFPRRIAAAIVAADRPSTRLVADIAAGPGAMLEALLAELPEAEAIWCDASEAMLAQAKERLAGFGGRVTYLIADMTDLDGAGLPGDLDALVTSRATHHLDRETLVGFYSAAAHRLCPGGWLVNLDHIGPSDSWDRRYRSVRKRFVPPSPPGSGHDHNWPLPSEADHLCAYRAAGITDVDVAWRAFYTYLFIGRSEGSDEARIDVLR